jgi:hypothetical protein
MEDAMNINRMSLEFSATRVRLLIFSAVLALLMVLLVQDAIAPSAPILKLHSTEASGSLAEPSPTPIPSPILFYSFESTPNNSGTAPNSNGTLVNATFSTDKPPCAKGLQSLNLNGSNAYVTIPDNFDYTATGAPGTNLDKLTIEAWVKPKTMSGQTMVWDDYGNPGVQLALVNGQVQFALSTVTHPGLGISNVSGMLIPNYWQHIAGVYDGSRMRVYINGQETCKLVTTSGRIIDQTSIGAFQAFIGGNNIGVNLFNGLIDDLRIFPVALDRTQLARGCFAEVPAIPCCCCL